jgi:cytochrome P450
MPEMLLDPVVIEDPYPFYRRLIQEAPVWHIDGTDIVVVSSFEAINEVVRRNADFSSNLRAFLFRNQDGTPGVEAFDPGIQALATADPPKHTVHRKAVFPELVAKRMLTLREEIEELAARHVLAAFAQPQVEAMHAIANPVPIRVVSKLIGFRDKDPDELQRAAFRSTSMLAATGPRERQIAAMEDAMNSVAWIAEQLDSAVNGSPAEGILEVIASAVNRRDIDAAEAFAVMATLLSAGGETTTGLIGNAIHLLATRPGLQADLREHPEGLGPFIEEMLRLESPLRYHMRHSRTATSLQGVDLPAGATLLLLWGAASRDPAQYERPDDVVLDRPTPKMHFGFGRGVHYCVGAPLARLEAEVILTEVLQRTGNFELDPGDSPVREHSLVVRRFTRLPLCVSAP